MNVLDIDRVLVATDDVRETAEMLDSLLGIKFGSVFEANGLESVMTRDNSKLDLISPLEGEDGNDVVRQFVEERGTGLYGLIFRVDDAEAARDELAEKGVDPFRVERFNEFTEYFYHPDDFGGLYVVLSEFPHSVEMNVKIAQGTTDQPARD